MYYMYSITCIHVFSSDHCRLVIETSHLDLTPSIIPYCVYIHCNSLFTYKDVITTWLKRASTLHDISTAGYVVHDTIVYMYTVLVLCNLSIVTTYGTYSNCGLYSKVVSLYW